MTRIAVYPGSFDPLTRGHEDLIRRSLTLADRLIVAVAMNVGKQPLFTVEERLEMLRAAAGDDSRVSFQSFDGLLAEFAKKVGATIIVRGLRAVSDFEYEFQMALMNRHLNPRIETVFMMPAESYSYLSSRLVKEVFQLGGRVRDLVPPIVERRLAEKYGAAKAPAASPRRRPRRAR
jgi:pantetheine-phosphate adenylyltransferase